MFLYSQEISQNLDSLLSGLAIKNTIGKGRAIDEPVDKLRTRFQVDRDRILHCPAFRRLKDKTQVYTPRFGDHFRDRLTHTLEVSQIARSLARNLQLNEDLAEVIALAHDLGHTPFGHAGETTLNKLLEFQGSSFEHNQQSFKMASQLNLNLESLEGLQKHQSPYDQVLNTFINSSLEAQVVNLADEIAYINHDLDDGLRSQVLPLKKLQNLEIIQLATQAAQFQDFVEDRPRWISQLTKLMLTNLLTHTQSLISQLKLTSLSEVYACTQKTVQFSDDFYSKVQALRQFLLVEFYNHPQVLEQTQEGQTIIEFLFNLFDSDITTLPEDLQTLIINGNNKTEVIKDYISGMTDSYAHLTYNRYALS